MDKIIYRPIWPILATIIILTGAFFVWQKSQANIQPVDNDLPEEEIMPEDKYEFIDIVPGSTFGLLLEEYGLSATTANSIYQSAEDVYDLASIRVGKKLIFVYDGESDELKEMQYQPNTEETLHVYREVVEDENGESQISWQAELKPIEYEVKEEVVSGTVESSMYQAALDNDIDIRAIIELAQAFQWTIDFAMDPRKGDEFKFVYEARYLDGEYIMPGQVLAGYYINGGEKYQVYYFEESEDNKGFFDVDGNSVQKIFLKAPVAYKYISSGFTTGRRYVEAFNVSTGHRAIDYAAPSGTPIRAVGDGTVISAGWSSVGYGYLTSVRHNGTYSTNYAHQSKIIVSYGQKVKQGEIIGYVGSTGFSTGPHLHYEMVKNGVKVNPLREILPPGKPIKEENKDRFYNEIKKYQDLLSN